METIQLGDVQIRPEENSLSIDGRSVHVEPKVMAVLEVLLEHPDTVVSRQALLQRVWTDRVVGEEVLTRCICELRTALGDEAKQPRYIQTVPKKGYRLLLTPVDRRSVTVSHWRQVAVAAVVLLAITLAAIAWLELTPVAERPLARATMEVDAADLYLLGRHYWQQRTPEGLTRAVDYLRRAVEADPEMAQAYSALADAYLLQTSYDDRDPDDAVELAAPLIDQALTLNPDLAEAHASRGILLQRLGDYVAAESALAHAVALDPGNVMAHMWRGNASLATGQLTTALEHYRSAYSLAPGIPAVAHNYINTLLELGRYNDARSILTSRPPGDLALVQLTAQIALESGDWTRVNGLADAMLEDPVGAALLRWGRAVRQQDHPAAETYLLSAIRQAPADERVYLAALEHRALEPGVRPIDDLIASWQHRLDISEKIHLMARGWEAIGRIRQGAPETGAAELTRLLDEPDADYPPFRLKLLSYLLTALEETGQLAAYDRWRTHALDTVTRLVDRGWGSFEFEVERGYVLAAAGDRLGAAESFRAAGQVGDLSTVPLAGDPRLQDSADLLKDFI